MEEVIHAKVDRMLDQDIIEPSSSSWSSPVVLVKKNDNKYRFCVDYRKLNSVTKISARPMPCMDSIAKYIPIIDLSMAFNQVPVKKEHRHYTAFTVPGRGLYQLKRLPFGLSGSPGTFQELMDRIIGTDLEYSVFCYLDGIIIMSKSFEEHKRILKEVLRRLNMAGLTINREKSHFCREEVKFLGVFIDCNCLRPDPEKIAPIINYPVPNTLKKLRSFLGAASWYCKLISDFATIAEPLTALMRKNAKYEWTVSQQKAFDQLKA